MLLATASSTPREDTGFLWVAFRALPGGFEDSVDGCPCGLTGVIPGMNSPWYVVRRPGGVWRCLVVKGSFAEIHFAFFSSPACPQFVRQISWLARFCLADSICLFSHIHQLLQWPLSFTFLVYLLCSLRLHEDSELPGIWATGDK